MESAVCEAAAAADVAADAPEGAPAAAAAAAVPRCGARLVILEVGCGLTVPSVRMEMECVLRDLDARLQSATPEVHSGDATASSEPHGAQSDHRSSAGAAGQVTMIRINPDFPQNPDFLQTVCIRARAEEALLGIEDAINEAAK